ncbi:Integral membrane protein [Tritrichomonas foetus]|uniref:Integral membrane protein n=1 Tax=Tritrichomonas foetus TaxID=1144522 RepID=A0A1J4KND2_9EUKA|nr:Integral membrane protein [Tritrichomonas foetus]|eukprot:OHT12823.1 Integral membrane protein [Tritrichomonas foetus]
MKCTVSTAIVFVFLSLIYGSAFAGNTQGLKYFNPSLYIAFRMLFGCVICVIILLFRLTLNPKEYMQVVQAHFRSGFINIIWVIIGGLLFHGVPQCIIAFAQKWVNSASVQLAQPISTCAGAISAHFFIPEERFTITKFISLVFALLGVALPAIPQFRRSGDGDQGAGGMAIGFVLLIVGTMCFGFAGTIMKLKTPNVDITVATMIQTAASAVICFIVSLAWDQPELIKKQCSLAPPIAWIWPVIVGILGTGVAGHGFTYLVQNLGATGASFITIGQVTVGVILGVAALGDWNGYLWWEILISVFGLLCLVASIAVEFALPMALTRKFTNSSDKDTKNTSTKASVEENEREMELEDMPNSLKSNDEKIIHRIEGYDDKEPAKIEEL